jgi:hypothetical protein
MGNGTFRWIPQLQHIVLLHDHDSGQEAVFQVNHKPDIWERTLVILPTLLTDDKEIGRPLEEFGAMSK